MTQRAAAAMSNVGNIIPYLRYRDAARAVEWLCQAFGFEAHSVTPGPDDAIVHAELRLGNGFIMLSSLNGGEIPSRTAADGKALQGIYIILDDGVDGHCDKARRAGAEIIRPPADMPYGSREYGARDLEGYYWSFGTYRPS